MFSGVRSSYETPGRLDHEEVLAGHATGDVPAGPDDESVAHEFGMQGCHVGADGGDGVDVTGHIGAVYRLLCACARSTEPRLPAQRARSIRSRDDWTALGNPRHGRHRPRFRQRPADRGTRSHRGRLALGRVGRAVRGGVRRPARARHRTKQLVVRPRRRHRLRVDAASDARRERDPRARARQARARREALHPHRRRGRRRARRRRRERVCSRWRRCGPATCRT